MDENELLELIGKLIRNTQRALKAEVPASERGHIKTRLTDCVSDLEAMTRDAETILAIPCEITGEPLLEDVIF